MTARLVALLACGLALAVAPSALAEQTGLEGLVPALPPLGVPAAPTVTTPTTPLDNQPGKGGASPGPLAPDLVGPSGGEGALWLVGGLGALTGLGALAVWGGTRFRGEEVLAHELRARIYRHVQDHVGASLKDITEVLGLSTTNAVWHLRKLEDSGLVRGRKFNGAKVYYPTSGGVQARNLSLAGAALTAPNARAILGFVAAHPGIHQREVARLLGINHGTVRWHLKKLRQSELLEERRTGPHTTYHVTALGTDALRAAAARSPAALGLGVSLDTPLGPPAGPA